MMADVKSVIEVDWLMELFEHPVLGDSYDPLLAKRNAPHAFLAT